MMGNNKIDEKVLEITLWEQQIKKLKDLVEKNKDELKAELDSRVEDSIDTGACKISYIAVVKHTLDTKEAKKFISENANLDDFIKKNTETRFTITVTANR